MQDLTQTVRYLVENGWNKGETSVADEYCCPGCNIDICIIKVPRGPDGLKRFIENSRRAFPDLNLRIEFLLQSGPLVFSSWVTFGTHKGDFLVPATGQTQRLRLLGMWLFSEGKLVDLRGNWEATTMMRAFGLMPAERVPSVMTDVPRLHQLHSEFPTGSASSPAVPTRLGALTQFLRLLFCADYRAAFAAAAPAPEMFWSCIRNFQDANSPSTDRRLVAYDHIRNTLANRHIYIERLVSVGDGMACRWLLTCNVVGPVFGANSGPRSTVIRGTSFVTLDSSGHVKSWYDVVDVVRQYRDARVLQDIDYYRHQPPETAPPPEIASMYRVC